MYSPRILKFYYLHTQFDERPVSVIDLKQGETIPIEIMLAMFDPKVKNMLIMLLLNIIVCPNIFILIQWLPVSG